MRKLLKMYSFKSLIRQFPKQNYCICRHIHNNTFSKVPSVAKIYSSYFSTASSPQDVSENNTVELNKEFREPKKILFEVLNEAFLKDRSLDLKPSIITEQISTDSSNGSMWKARFQMKWPEAFEIEGLANRKTEALNICFVQACQKLKQLGVLDQSNKPVLQKRKFNEQDMKAAKSNLINLYQKIWHRYGIKEYLPKFNTALVQGLFGNYWQAELNLSYPEKKVFTSTALRSTSAESIAAYEALLWLKDKGIINKKCRLIEYSKNDETRLKESYDAPYSISLPPILQEKMQNVLTDIKRQKSLLLGKDATAYVNPMEEESNDDCIIKDIITENTYFKLTDQQLYDRSRYLYERNRSVERNHSSKLADIKKAKDLLPIFQRREDILKLIDENQVVVLSGDTGCGKSTQVPQYILDHYIDSMKGAECNIIVTQPRRLSALSLAERVANERGEKIGDIVGHRIRLNKALPQGNGAILYCTTGVLLRKLYSNPDLEGISHVIIDEVHERNIQIDLILILLKDLLKNNKNLKVLLMSASFNTNLFAQYFNSSAVIHVPGKMYPVDEYFLEDLVDHLPSIKNIGHMEANLDVDLIVEAVNHIDKKEPPGAILCFLPGWHDIRAVHNKLLENDDNRRKLLICPIHSRLSTEEQRKIFLKPSESQRKVILATNIAETSLTIDDVVYVVNSGLHKGTYFDAQADMASLCTQWITKANVRQRKGRAGRVKPGKCYHLFSWKTFMKMAEYPIPEISRMPLESVILDSKLYCEATKSEEFLSKALQPPSTAAIQIGLKELQMLDVLDENENVTNLGKIVMQLPLHPRLSVALIYAAFLGCLDPVLTISSILTLEKEPFANTLDDKLQIRKIKEMHDNGLYSDHLALAKIFDTWSSLTEEADIAQYIKKNLLDDQALLRIKQLKEMFVEEIYTSGLIDNGRSYKDVSCEANAYHFHAPSILAALTVAFFPNVIKVLQGEISDGKLNKESLIYSIIRGQKAYIQKESVASDAEELPTPWLIYFSALRSEARRKAMVSSVSTVPGICLLLLAGRDLTMTKMVKENMDEKHLAVLTIDNYSKVTFSCTDEEARLLLDWRACLFEMFNLFILNLKENCEEREYVLSCLKTLIPVLKELLETPQVPFTKGQTYQFVNNELIATEF